MNNLLSELHDLLRTDQELLRSVGFRVMQKGQRDAERLKQFQNYEGPDDSTQRLLEDYSQVWHDTPSSIWNLPSDRAGYHFTNPHAHIVGVYVRAGRDSA